MPALIDGVVKILQVHKLVKRVRIVNYDETPRGKLELKIRCQLIKNYQFQVWLHHEPDFEDYAFQLFTDRPLLRWDNAPHYPDLSSAPHHFHDENITVSASPLTGSVQQDLEYVLAEVEKWLESKEKKDE